MNNYVRVLQKIKQTQIDQLFKIGNRIIDTNTFKIGHNGNLQGIIMQELQDDGLIKIKFDDGHICDCMYQYIKKV